MADPTNFNRAKRFLWSYNQMQDRIELRLDHLKRIRAKLEVTGQPEMSGMPHGGQTSDWADLVAKYMELEEDIKQEISELRRRRKIVMNTIQKLEDERMRELIEMRYIAGWSWTKIHVKMRYAEAQCFRLHCEALRLLDNMIDDNDLI